MLSILHKNSKPSQTWRLEVNLVQQEVGCKGWTAASSKTPPSEAAGSFPKQPNVTCNSELHHLKRCVVRHTYTSLKGHVSPPRGHMPMSNCTFEVSCKWSGKTREVGQEFTWDASSRAGLELQNMHCQPGILTLEVSRLPLPRRQTTSFHVRSLLCRACLPTKAGYF